MKLNIYIISMIVGAGYILTHLHDRWAVGTIGILMIADYLLFMATFPKDTNIISHYLSNVPSEQTK